MLILGGLVQNILAYSCIIVTIDVWYATWMSFLYKVPYHLLKCNVGFTKCIYISKHGYPHYDR